ncbi:hypothetical protein P7K49_029779, partial [Saguinus oedipus]
AHIPWLAPASQHRLPSQILLLMQQGLLQELLPSAHPDKILPDTLQPVTLRPGPVSLTARASLWTWLAPGDTTTAAHSQGATLP